MEYSFFYKNIFEDVSETSLNDKMKYDLFISAYNESHRVKFLFNNVDANNKHWVLLPEYHFNEVEIAAIQDGEKWIYTNDYNGGSNKTESDIILDYFNKNEELFNDSKRIAIDITGMLRPYIIYLVRLLKFRNIRKVDFIYSEPISYEKKEDTQFSLEHLHIRSVDGCEGHHDPETNKDLLIIASGFDNLRISRIARFKKQSKKVQLLGFPSLQADMFQQNILKSYKSENEVLSGEFNLDSKEIILAPANDPFITAQSISDYIKREEKSNNFTNIYLCPLSTKAQTLGMAIYYTFEGNKKKCSIIFPFSKKYSRETTKGLSKVCVYTLEYY